MLVSPGSVSADRTLASADEAVLLEALAEAGDALTSALVAHDCDAIVAATGRADALVRRLDGIAPDMDLHRRDRDLFVALTARIGVSARRNAVLLEEAWMTDAAILRLLAAAARDADAAPGAYAPPASALPAGWLDRSA